MTKRVFFRPQRARMRSYFDRYRGVAGDLDPYVRSSMPPAPLVVVRLAGQGSAVRGSQDERHDLVRVGEWLDNYVGSDHVTFYPETDDEREGVRAAVVSFCERRGRWSPSIGYQSIDWTDLVDFLERMGGEVA